MRVVIVYESMFGNTRAIAEAIAEGFGPGVRVLAVTGADEQALEGADLVIVGGPTHWSRMSRQSTRKSAAKSVRQPGSDLALESCADTGPGAREWLDTLHQFHARAAAFDTRYKAPAAIHRPSVQGYRSGVITSRAHSGDTTGELPRGLEEPPAAGRDGSGVCLGCTTGDDCRAPGPART